MSKDKTYILRRPIKAKRMNSENWRDIFEVDMPASWDAEQSITYELQEDDFNKTFVELDVAGLTRQVEEIVVRGLARSANREKIRQNAPAGTPLLEKRAYELYGEPVIDTIEMVEAILDLLLNQEKETK